jgi:hypothetical protein
MTYRHTVTNHGSHPIMVHLKDKVCQVHPGTSVTGVVLEIVHGDRPANYTMEAEERRYEPCRCAMRNKFELMARCPFPNDCKYKADRANGEIVNKPEEA